MFTKVWHVKDKRILKCMLPCIIVIRSLGDLLGVVEQLHALACGAAEEDVLGAAGEEGGHDTNAVLCCYYIVYLFLGILLFIANVRVNSV